MSPPSCSIDEHVATTLARGQLPPMTSLVDLQRLVDDAALSDYHRDCAEKQ